jgi:hypothetical protein
MVSDRRCTARLKDDVEANAECTFSFREGRPRCRRPVRALSDSCHVLGRAGAPASRHDATLSLHRRTRRHGRRGGRHRPRRGEPQHTAAHRLRLPGVPSVAHPGASSDRRSLPRRPLRGQPLQLVAPLGRGDDRVARRAPPAARLGEDLRPLPQPARATGDVAGSRGWWIRPVAESELTRRCDRDLVVGRRDERRPSRPVAQRIAAGGRSNTRWPLPPREPALSSAPRACEGGLQVRRATCAAPPRRLSGETQPRRFTAGRRRLRVAGASEAGVVRVYGRSGIVARWLGAAALLRLPRRR